MSEEIKLNGRLQLTGPGGEKGIFLRDSNGQLIDINLPIEFLNQNIEIIIRKSKT